MKYALFDVEHGREIARNTRRTRDLRSPARRVRQRDMAAPQPFAIARANESLIYTAKPTEVQSVEVTLWSFDGDDEVAGSEVIDVWDYLSQGCLIGEPLYLFRRPWQDGFRIYFVGTWQSIIVQGAIPGRVGAVPGSASCTWWEIDDSGELASTEQSVTVLNVATQATIDGSYLQAKKHNGIFVVDFEECIPE